jgi:hypothetical protein
VAAEAILVSVEKLAGWMYRGWIHSRKTLAQCLWVLWADTRELMGLRKLAALSYRGGGEYPPELNTSKDRTRVEGG